VPIVIDASLTAAWHFEDERSNDADLILDSLETDTAFVPLIWWFEIRNVITHGERRNRATQEQTASFLILLAGLPIGLDSVPDETSLIALSRKHALTFYDSAYLELAKREGLALATFDKQLVKAARLEGVPLVLAAP
jgi:predicted nucleic acid-binding protein